MASEYLHKDAKISLNDQYRYSLLRVWDSDKGRLNVIGLNPSTADAMEDDNTIRKCVKFAKAWGYGSLEMTNLFGFRATEPSEMKASDSPVGFINDTYLENAALCANMVLAAWGNDGAYRDQDVHVVNLLMNLGVDLHCLKLTKRNQPWHPLYVKDATKPILYRGGVK